MIALPIIWFLAVLIWDVTTDVKKWRAGITINHDKEAWIRVGLLIPSTIGFALHGTFWLWPAAVLMQGFVFWFLFNGFFNLLRGFGWFTPATGGSTDDSRLDKLPLPLQVGLQIGGSIVFTILYIWLL